MSFDFEADMYTTVLGKLPPLLGLGSHYAYATEIPLSYRIADLGFIPLKSVDLSAREAQFLARLDLKQIWALAYVMGNQRATISDISEMLSSAYRRSELGQVISALSEGGLIESDDAGFLVPSHWLGSHSRRVIFVELKLSRWKEALKQATFYRSRAEISCVTLDGDLATHAEPRDFIAEGIGLFAAWPNDLEMLVPPKANDGISVLQKNFNWLRAIRDLAGTTPSKWTYVSKAKEVA